MEGFWYLFDFDLFGIHCGSSRPRKSDRSRRSSYPPPPRPRSSSYPPRRHSDDFVRVRRSKHSGRKKLDHVRRRPRESYSPEWPRESYPSSQHRESYSPEWPRESRPSSRLPSDVQRPAYVIQPPAPAASPRAAIPIPGAYGQRVPPSAMPGAAYGERAPLSGKPGWEVIEPRDPEMGRPVVVDLRGR